MAWLVAATLLSLTSATAHTSCHIHGDGCAEELQEVSALLQYSRARRSKHLQKAAATADPWSSDGSFFGVQPWDVTAGLSQARIIQVYGNEAMAKAHQWVEDKKTLWCGDQSDPDGTLPPGTFPFDAPTTAQTYWTNSCPKSTQAQDIFNKGLAWRMLFNDNEAACAFQAAADVDPTCALAPLTKAYSMGPNVNYAELANAETYLDILTALTEGQTRLQQFPDDQSEYAQGFYEALLKFYCVAGPDNQQSTLESMFQLAQSSPDEAYSKYMGSMSECTHDWALATSALANQFPGDPNINSIATGALMQDPAWKWWHTSGRNSSLIAGATSNVTSDEQDTNVPNQTIVMASSLIENHAAIANTMIERALNVAPLHLGGLHFAIHNLEQGPYPDWGESAADKLLANSAFQGHALHMQTHIATRVGRWNDSIAVNLASVVADTVWNINRTGGGIQSLLYKYVPHNTAFAAEAAQHGFMFKDMAGSISLLNYASGFGYEANPALASLSAFLKQQFQRPTRFGKYAELLEGTNPGGNAPLTVNATQVNVFLPQKTYSLLDSATPNIMNGVIWARTVSFSRLGFEKEANESLADLVEQPLYQSMGCNETLLRTKHNISEKFGVPVDVQDPVFNAIVLAECQRAIFLGSKNQVLSSESSMATGTLTINNGNLVASLDLLTAAAEVTRFHENFNVASTLAILRTGFEWQKELQYDEPAPFFYPIGETLAGELLKVGTTEALDEAEEVLRTVLFQWPRSALASYAMYTVLSRKGQTAAASYALAGAVAFNDTEIKLEYL